MPSLGAHVALSTATGGAVWAATGEWPALPIALATGVLPDADHLLDYYNWYVRGNRKRIFFIFHGWEYVLALLAAYMLFTSPLILAALVAYVTHVGSDQIFNSCYRWTYSIIARARFRFHAAKVAQWDLDTAYEALASSIPFGQRFVRDWFSKRT